MDIVFRHVGQVVVINVLYLWDIEATGGHICRHQDLDLAGLEIGDGTVALTLGFVAVDRGRRKPLTGQKLVQLFGPVLRAAKHNGAFIAVFVDQFDQQVRLGGFGHEVNRLFDPINRFTRRVDLHADRAVKKRAREFAHQLRHCRRKQHGLARCRQKRCDLAQGVDEPHIEHLVSFIENQEFGVSQTNSTTFQQVDQTTGCRDQQINAAFKLADLACDTSATDNKHRFQVCASRIRGEIFLNLFRQFARWGQDQRAGGLCLGLALFFQQHVDHRQTEGGGFTTACLGKAHDVATIHRVGDCLCLNRRRVNDALAFQFSNQSGREAQHIEIHL